MAIHSGYTKAAAAAQRLGTAMFDSTKKAFSGVTGLNVPTGSGGAVTKVGRFGGSLMGGTASALGGIMNKTAFVFEKFPKTMFLGTVLTGGLIIRNHYRGKHEASAAETQARQQMSYMATTNPREFALMNERMRGSVQGENDGHAAAVLQEREAASQQVK